MLFSKSDEKVAELGGLEVFAACSQAQLAKIAGLADEVHFPARTTLMREGDAGRECFVIVEGEADVRIRGRCIARVRRGDIVGEMALIEHEPRTATVVARAPVRALALSPKTFPAVLDCSPAVARRVLRTLAQRLRAVQAA